MKYCRPLQAALAVSALLLASPSGADDRVTLTPAEVECNRNQLRELLERASVVESDGSSSERVQTLFVSYSNRFGSYEGLVVSGPWERDEPPVVPPGHVPGEGRGLAHLSFHLNPDVRQLLLNPARIPLEQMSITREVSTSTLVEPGSSDVIELRLRPTLGMENRSSDLVIDNLAAAPPAGDGFRPADTKPGRGLTAAGLTATCHERFTATDRWIFAILQRTLTPVLLAEDTFQLFDTRVAIYRGESPHHYTADVYPVDPETGGLLPVPVRVGISARVDEDGRLAEGGIGLTEGSYAGFVGVARPVFPGVNATYEYVATAAPTPVGVVPGEDFDWRDVLQDTTWNRAASTLGSRCGQGTPEEIAATPRQDPNLEHMALRMGGGLTADPVVYGRVVEDVAAISSDHPELPSVEFIGPWLPDEVLLGVEPATYDAMRAGGYRAWDCLNDWYGLEEIRFAPHSKDWLVLDVEGVYDVPVLARDYGELPGVLWTGPNSIAGDSPRLCGAIEGETYRYVVRDARGDCPAGCIQEDLTLFTSEPGERPVLRDTWSTGDTDPRPPWAEVCG